MALLARRRHDTGVAATAGQKERNVGVHLVMYLVNGLPGRHVIAHCADHEHRRVNIRQRDRLAQSGIESLGSSVQLLHDRDTKYTQSFRAIICVRSR